MKVIYIAGRFRGPNHWEIHQNILRAEEVIAQLIGRGYAVISTHKITENMQGLYPDRVYLDMCLEILSRCDAIFMLKGWEKSEGSIEELKMAQELKLEIIYE